MRPTETIAMAKTLTREEQPGNQDENGKDILGLIGFMHDDVFIHDPWMSTCSRFEVEPYDEYHERDVDRFIDLTCDTHFIEMNSGASCRGIAASVIRDILEDVKEAGEDAWDGSDDILDRELQGADSRGWESVGIVRSTVLEIIEQHDPR